ncbi:hypothetical protein D3C78_740470 [compost metagenome]
MLSILVNHDTSIYTGILPFGSNQTIWSCWNRITFNLRSRYILHKIGSRPVWNPVGAWQNTSCTFREALSGFTFIPKGGVRVDISFIHPFAKLCECLLSTWVNGTIFKIAIFIFVPLFLNCTVCSE